MTTRLPDPSETATETVIVRAAEQSDLDALVRLERACFDPPWSRSDLALSLNSPLTSIWVLGPEDCTSVTAYALYQTVAGESELLRIGVDPTERGAGHGGRLLAEGLGRLRREDVRICHLEVRASNAPALALYERLGFVVTGRRPKYYPGGVDAVLLAVDLDQPEASTS